MVIGKRTIGTVAAIVVGAAVLFCIWTFVVNVGGADNPSAAVGYFIVAVKERDYGEARKYLTKDAASMYDQYDLDRFSQQFISEIAMNSPSSVEIRGDFATGVIWLGGGESKYNVNLEKKFGRWRISSIR